MNHRRGTTLVTGGVGFLGRHLVAQLAESHSPVRVIDVRQPDRPVAGVEYLRASITDAEALRTAMRGVSTVFHVAGIPDLWSRDRTVFRRVNAEGTRSVCTAALTANVDRLIYTSTALLTGEAPQERLVCDSPDETQQRLSSLPGDYTRSKYLAEQAVAEAVNDGLPAVVIRPGALIGPGDVRPTPPGRLLLDIVARRLPAYVDTPLHLVDVRDVADAHRFAVTEGTPGEILELEGHHVWLRELLTTIQELTGVPVPRRRIPYVVASAVSVVEAFLAKVGWVKVPMSSIEGVRIARRAELRSEARNSLEDKLVLRSLQGTLVETFRSFEHEGLLEPETARSLRNAFESRFPKPWRTPSQARMPSG